VAETVIHPRLTGIWPDGEPQSVRDAADRLAQARQRERTGVPAPRAPGDGRQVPAPARGGRSR
jgi:hypothetical protein